jgi:hypothetical protein
MALHDKVYIHPQHLPEEAQHIICWQTEDLGLDNGSYLIDLEGCLCKITEASAALAFYHAYYQDGTPLPDGDWIGQPQAYDGAMELTGPGHVPVYEGAFENGYFQGMNYCAGELKPGAM